MTRQITCLGLDASHPHRGLKDKDLVHPSNTMFYPPMPGPYNCKPMPKSFLGRSIFRFGFTSRSVMSSEGMGSPNVQSQMEAYLYSVPPTNPAGLIVVGLFSFLAMMVYSGAYFWL